MFNNKKKGQRREKKRGLYLGRNRGRERREQVLL
jgi:hypothetical protein